MDTALILTGLGVIVAAIGVAATVIVWALKSVFNLGGLHAKVDALTEKVDILTDKVDTQAERVNDLVGLHVKVDTLTEKVDTLAGRVDDLGDLHARVDTLAVRVDLLDGRVDLLTERVDDLSNKVDALAEGQRALQADLHQVINLLTALANHRHDVDGNTVFNLPSNPIPDRA